MSSRLIAGFTAAAVLVSSSLPVHAFERYEGYAPNRDVSAKLSLSIPFGPRTLPEEPAWLGLGLSATRDFDGHQLGLRDNVYYRTDLAEFRWSQDETTSLRLGNTTAFQWDQNGKLIDDEERKNLMGNGNGILGLAVLVALGIGLYLIIDDDGDDNPVRD